MRTVAVCWAFALVSVPTSVGAEVLAHSAACGAELRLERTADGGVALVGAGDPLPLGTGTGAFEAVTVGHGTVVIVRVQAEDSPVGAAILHCRPAGVPEVLWHGSTVWQGEDIGDQTRAVVRIERDANGPRVILGQQQRGITLAPGVWPLRDVRTVDPVSLRLVPATDNPLSQSATELPHEHLVRAVAGSDARGVVPLVALDEGMAYALDGRTDTALPTPPGTVLIASARAGQLTVRGLDLVAPSPGALPRRFTVLTEPGSVRSDVEIPAGLSHARSVRVPFAPDTHVTRVALVVSEGPPGAAVAELVLRTELDDPGTDPLARLIALAAQPSGDDATALLIAQGDRGVAALVHALPDLHGPAAARAVRALGSTHRPDVADVLVAAIARRDIAREALAALRDLGAPALAPLSAAVVNNPRAVEAIAALRVPAEARLRAVLPVLEAPPAVWRTARPTVAGILHAGASTGLWRAWLAMLPDAPVAISRGLVLAETEAPGADARATVTADARSHWPAITDFDSRYRMLSALGGNVPGRAILADIATGDPDTDLRAEATRALGITGQGDAVLLRVLTDHAPRVRAAAATGLACDDATRAALVRALANDPWPTVRAAAARSLAGDAVAVPQLLSALDQPSMLVVEAVLRSLGRAPVGADGVTGKLVDFVNDTRRNPDLRRQAAEALAVRCDPASAEALERATESLSDPALPPTEQEISHETMAALARTDPVRARALLHRLGANAAALAAVEAAIQTGCRPVPAASGATPEGHPR